jgi:hypothetical protein
MSIRRIVLDNAVDLKTLEALAADPELELDVTPLDLGRLPARVVASLSSQAAVFDAPHLRSSEHIHAPHATPRMPRDSARRSFER